MAKAFGYLLALLGIATINVSGEKKINTLCYGLPTYITQTPRPFTCRLWQPNWASETVFELTFLHCQEIPTVQLFIRNFYGVDEINTYFNPKYKKIKTRLYTGVLARLDLDFKIVKGNKKIGVRPSVRVLVYLVPDHKFSPEKRLLLTGVYYSDIKDDCSFYDSMSLHSKIFAALGLVAGLIIIPIVVTIIRRWHRNRGSGSQKKTFCVWFFKCDQGLEHTGRNGFVLRDMNGHAATDRLI
ncbi:uncharacterized protein LOC135688747 [Rhopilema esculentum]|uniref:uncharacterized protein LOC135688747 n=1 Tax=Rhopilema esculentum TaxID=499914 RepID=UPI0031D39672